MESLQAAVRDAAANDCDNDDDETTGANIDAQRKFNDCNDCNDNDNDNDDNDACSNDEQRATNGRIAATDASAPRDAALLDRVL